MNIADYFKKGIIYWPTWFNIVLLRLNVFGKLVYGASYFKVRKTLFKKNPEKLLIESVNHAIQNVKYYRDRYGGVEIRDIEDFRAKIGFIDKEEVLKHWDDFIVDDIDYTKCNVLTTGGTSGKAMKLVVPSNRYIIESIFVHKIREKTSWKVGKKRAMIRNHRLPQNRNFLVNPLTKDFIFDAFRTDDEYICFIYNTIKKYKIEVIHAYPSSLYQFFKLCEKQGLDLSNIKTCLLSSEGITDEQYWYFTKYLNKEISFSYGHSEKLILGSNINSQDSRMLVEPHYGYFELIDDEEDQVNELNSIGEMVGTTYFNRYMPLIRYKTGDYAEYGGKDQSDVYEKVVLKKVYGRWDKSAIYKINGTKTSITALNLHGDFYNHIDGMQYIQEKRGYLTVLIIKNPKYTSKDEEFIVDHVGNAMGGGQYVNIKYVDKLILQDNGKFLPIISKV